MNCMPSNGPWIRSGQAVVDRMGNTLAIITSPYIEEDCRDLVQANGDVMVASLELLEALERLERVASVELGETRPDVLNQARAAINRARGRSEDV